MPVLNEERHLAESVHRLLAQEYEGPIEVVLAIGPSKDRTAQIAAALSQADPRVIVVENPTGKTPAGLNAAIAASHHDIVVRMDAHALVDANYVAIAVETLERTGAENVGGVMAAEGTTPFQQAVATAMTSKIGVGGASFHVGGEEGPALTVYLGCFRRAALERVGGYDEAMERAQDWEMNYRIRETGGVVWFNPALHVTYRPRRTISALARQYFDYGRWRREVARRYPHTLSMRYLAPPTAVVLLVLAIVMYLVGMWVFWPAAFVGGIVIIGYVLLVVLGSLLHLRDVSFRAWLWLPLVIATMHMSWGTGFLRGGAHT